MMMLKIDDDKIAPEECAECIMPQCAICKHDPDPEEPEPPEFPDFEEDYNYYDDWYNDWDDDYDY